jgi:hypothetical protein
MFVGARRAVRASAGAEFNLSFVEIFLELGLFFFSYFGIFILRTQGAAPEEMKLIVAHNVLVEDGDITTGRLQTAVPKECCPDMDR